MVTLQDIVVSVSKAKEALDTLSVSGRDNALKLCYAYDRCQEVLDMINLAVNEIQNESSIKIGEDDGIKNIGNTEPD